MGTTDAQRKLFFKLRSEAEKIYALTQTFDPKLIAERMGVQPQDVIDMDQRLTKSDMSLNTPVGEDSDTEQMDFLTEEDQKSAQDIFEKKELIALLKKEAKSLEKELNERDRFIFKERILSHEPITLQELGYKFGITRERARQLESRIIKKIKERLLKANSIQVSSS